MERCASLLMFDEIVEVPICAEVLWELVTLWIRGACGVGETIDDFCPDPGDELGALGAVRPECLPHGLEPDRLGLIQGESRRLPPR